LLWVAVLHHHDALASSAVPSSLHSASQSKQATAEGRLICAVCQIVRHNALQPAMGAATPMPVLTTRLRRIILAGDIYSYDPAVVFGRAPPFA
jgi:hypothetical protein